MKTTSWLTLAVLVIGTGFVNAEPTATTVNHEERVVAGGVAPPEIGEIKAVQSDAQDAHKGEALFYAMNCDACHGVDALGFVGPSLVDGRWRFGGDDRTVFHSIFAGRPHGMPAYGGLLTEATIWQLVGYLRSRPIPADVPTTAWGSTASSVPERQ